MINNNKNKINIVQTVIGSVRIGNAGLSRIQIKDGYCMMLCTIGTNEQIVDIALTKKQATSLRDELNLEFPIEHTIN